MIGAMRGLLVWVIAGLSQSCGTAPPRPTVVEPVAVTPSKIAKSSFVPTKLVHLPGGTFEMGDRKSTARERPVHSVTLAPFALEEHEVTARQYNSCVEAKRCTPALDKGNFDGLKMDAGDADILNLACNGSDPMRESHPITCVDWHQATAYCAWLGRRLPTEEEWEFAGRGKESRTFVWGEREDLEQGGANTLDQSFARFAEKHNFDRGGAKQDDGYPLTAPPKSFPADRTPEGVYDLAGNVTEWTASKYCLYSEPDCSSEEKVIRGANWFMEGTLMLSGRDDLAPHLAFGSLGFRCAASAPHTLK